MSPRTEPAIATWLLKLFCSAPEYEPLIGDLLERYRQRGGRLWYWRQVFGIVWLRMCRGGFWRDHRAADENFCEVEAQVRESHAPPTAGIDSSRIPMGGGAGAGILMVLLLGAVLHDLPLLRLLAIPGILAGLFYGLLLRLWGKLHPRDVSKQWLSIRTR